MLPLSAAEGTYGQYRNVQRGDPRPDVELAVDPLTARCALASSGVPPYVDLAIWGSAIPR